MATRRHAVKARVDGFEHAAKLALACEELADEIAHVPRLNVAGLQASAVKRALHGTLHQLEQPQSFAGSIHCEVGLGTAQDVDGLAHGFILCLEMGHLPPGRAPALGAAP